MTTQHLTASDLMLGDWVQVVDEITGTPFACRVAFMYAGHIGLDGEIDDSSLPIECVQPIPLTPEILEKNGWHKFQMYYRLGIDKQQYMEYYPLLGRLQRIYKHKDNKEEVVFTCGALSYVHLLQHALKLCEIDKEIIL